MALSYNMILDHVSLTVRIEVLLETLSQLDRGTQPFKKGIVHAWTYVPTD